MWLLGKRKEAVPHDAGEATAVFFRRALGDVCPGCEQKLAEHKFAKLASLAVRKDNRDELIRYFKVFKQGDWVSLSEYHSFDASLDTLITYALVCPAGWNSAVVIRDPFELYDTHELMTFTFVANEEFDQLRSMIDQSKWIQF